ncbi:MAG TPA: hypothetical protein PKH78_04250, partial [Candidatus Obscuribacter sp.]|nr:hypothetical protein [Candidatus Obscuribacter sp.]
VQLKAGQEKRPLRLVFENGADGGEKLADISILLNRQPISFTTSVTARTDDLRVQACKNL